MKCVLILLTLVLTASSVKLRNKLKGNEIPALEAACNKKDIEMLGFNHLNKTMTPTKDFTLVRRMPRYHDDIFFVQGFKFLNEDTNTIIESAGLYGQSSIHKLNLDKMTVEKKVPLENNMFGEGCDWIINRMTKQKEIHQMTYRERKVFVYDEDLNLLREQVIPEQMKEGWGIKRFIDQKDQSYFYTTDGSDQIFVIDPIEWKVIASQKVVDSNNQPIYMLNEMEIIDNYLYINLYLSYSIAKVNPYNNFVAEKIFNFEPLVEEVKATPYYKKNRMNYGDCLNGIAYNNKDKKLYLTGKKWPIVYEVKLNQ